MRFELPEPAKEAQAHSLRLQAHIREEIDNAGGWIPFSRYMELCLYTPGLGYYSAGLHKFGAEGDFVTAPELGPLFARTLAHVFCKRLEGLGGGVIIELGGGSGRLAADALAQMEQLGCLPDAWMMLERSADLRQRQAETLQQSVPHLLDRVQWLERIPDQPWPSGIVFGNEVLDALPVEILRLDHTGVLQAGISKDTQGMQWHWQPAPAALSETFQQRIGPQAPGYTSEICPLLPDWIQALGSLLHQGYWLFSDYGYPRNAYYHPQRHQGTLQCHYRHRAHEDVLFWPGLQDITAHVDFDALAEACQAAAMHVDFIGYQGEFLLQNGLTQVAQALLESPDMSADQINIINEIKQLTLPGEMGERFLFLQASRLQGTA